MAKSTYARTPTAGAAQHPDRVLSQLVDNVHQLLKEINETQEQIFAVASAGRCQDAGGGTLFAVIERLTNDTTASARLRQLVDELASHLEIRHTASPKNAIGTGAAA